MRTLTLTTILVASLARVAGAVLIPGGGPPRPDCYLEFDVEAREVSARVAECTDGDPSCDFDGACDDSCRFNVAVCLNQADPALPNCAAPFPPSALLRAGERGFDPVGLRFPSFGSSACGAFVGVDAPVRARGRPGRRIKTIAVSPTRPKRDRDVLKLVCRRAPGGCPPTTTTTTTTTSPVPTTTTMTPATIVPAAADTAIFSGSPDANLGDFGSVFIGNDGESTQRTLLRFDLSAIPPTSSVSGCTLIVDVVTHNQPSAGKIYRVKQPAWGETTATWNRYDGVSTWTTAGAFNAVELLSDVVVTPGPDGPVAYEPPEREGAFTFPNLTGLCQDAVTLRSGDLNLMIKQDADAPGVTAELAFSRRTDSVEAERPRLQIVLAP